MIPDHEIVFDIVHDMKKMTPHFQYINEFINTDKNNCAARNAYKHIEKIFNSIMAKGCKSIQRHASLEGEGGSSL